MARRVGSSRAFFPSGTIAACLAAAGCATSQELEAADPAALAHQRAQHWRTTGFPAIAARQFEESALLAAADGDAALEISCRLDAAECWLLDGRPSVAAIDVERAERALFKLPSGSSRLRAAQFRVSCARGDLELLAGRRAQARELYEQALRGCLGAERDQATVRLQLVAEQEGDRRRARSYAGQLADPDDPRLAEVRRMLAASGIAPAARAPLPPTPLRPPEPAARSSARGGPPVLPRTAWGARRARSNLDRMTQIWRVTVHHTATKLSTSSSRAAADAIRTFQRQHQDDKGWADIGYHFVIDPSGRIWEGRPLAWQGAHAGSPELNVGNVGIALIGDFTLQQPSASQKKALCDLLDSLCARYGVRPSHVYTHQEIRPGPTDCPGPALERIVAAWRRSATPAL